MIDWDRVLELKSEVGEDVFGEIIEMFFEEVREALNELSQVRGNALEERLHFIKGCALNIGLREVSELCRIAESSTRDSASDTINLEDIRRAFENSVVQFRA
ncbi:MAG: Hpt domain-containing protein [Boseongicola sp.]|nr:Hpt domain-containing protein [Boseongicola sp.]NNL17718.1 Hpt domain-containing protein [Boseongicola sp.]